MPDTILHVVDIEAPPADVHRALSTQGGLSSWWSTVVEAEERVGGFVTFKFNQEFNPRMEVTALERPSTVAWRCVAGHEPWHDATLRFDVAPLGDGRARLTFTQRYGRPLDDTAYGIYNYNWGYYLHSLKQAVETGDGFPHRPA